MLPQKYIDALYDLNEQQLRELNRRIVERLKLLDRAHGLTALARFAVGDWVYFMHNGRKVVGTITKLNQKTATIHTTDHQHWNVSPLLLVKNVDSK